MELGLCPYCEAEGLVTTMKVTAQGFEVTGRCEICGYSYDSEFAASEIPDDLPFEFSKQVEFVTLD